MLTTYIKSNKASIFAVYSSNEIALFFKTFSNKINKINFVAILWR